MRSSEQTVPTELHLLAHLTAFARSRAIREDASSLDTTTDWLEPYCRLWEPQKSGGIGYD